MTNDKQRERLVELLCESEREYMSSTYTGGYFTYISDYLLANGIIVPPCKVGDKVYRISTRSGARIKYIQETTVSRVAIDTEGTWIFCTCNPIAKTVFGKTVFLTREEAEAKLKGGVQG